MSVVSDCCSNPQLLNCVSINSSVNVGHLQGTELHAITVQDKTRDASGMTTSKMLISILLCLQTSTACFIHMGNCPLATKTSFECSTTSALPWQTLGATFLQTQSAKRHLEGKELDRTVTVDSHDLTFFNG